MPTVSSPRLRNALENRFMNVGNTISHQDARRINEYQISLPRPIPAEDSRWRDSARTCKYNWSIIDKKAKHG